MKTANLWLTLSLVALTQLNCQLLAGVKTDAELLGGSGGTGGTTTSSAGGNTAGSSTVSSGGGGGCSSSDECSGGACLDGVCVTAKCTPEGQPIVAFSSDDLSQHTIEPGRVLLVADSDRAHIAVFDSTAPRLLVRTITNEIANPVTPQIEYTLPSAGIGFERATVGQGKLHVYGRVGESVGEVEFPIANKEVGGPGQFLPFPALPAECLTPNQPHDVDLDVASGTTRYALNCQGTNAALLLGDNGTSPSVILSGSMSDPALTVARYAYTTEGTHFILAENDNGESGVPYRFGKAVADLQDISTIQLSDDPNFVTLAVDVAKNPESGISALLGSVSSVDFSGTFYGGVVKDADLGSLSMVPPPGLTPIATFEEAPFKDFSPLVPDPTGHLLSVTSFDSKSVLLLWFDKTLTQVITEGILLYQSPSAPIIGTNLVRVQQRVFVSWVEFENGLFTVKVHPFSCSY